MYYLAVDIGSTFLKYGLISAENHSILNMRSIPSPVRKPTEDFRQFEYDAKQYVAIVSDLICDAVDTCESDIRFLLSTQMHGFVVDDTYISWQDSRCLGQINDGVSYLDHIKRIVPPEAMQTCGVYFKPALGVCNLFTKLYNEKRLNQDIEVFTLGSYIIHQLTGKNCCHITNAAPIGFADIERRVWREDLFAELGLSHLRLPQISKEDYLPCGECVMNGKKVTFYPDYGDQQVSVLGSGADENTAIINIATASQVITFSDTPNYNAAYETRPYFDNAYINVLSNMPGGRTLNVLVRFIQEIGRKIYHTSISDNIIYSYIGNLASVETKELSVDMSFYPTYDKFNGGSISHITSDNLQLDTLFSAAYEAMAKEYKAGMDQISKASSLERIICIGGVAQKNGTLRKIMESVFQRPCMLPKNVDEVISGLLRIAEKIAAID